MVRLVTLRRLARSELRYHLGRDMKWPVCLPMFAMMVGCAYLRRAPSVNPAAAVTATEQQMAKHEAALSTPRPKRGKASCTRARALRDDVCTLGQRVCLLSRGDPAIPAGADRCKRASLQCEKASTKASATCRPARSRARASQRTP